MLTYTAHAQQTGFYTGLHGAFQATWILNSDDSDKGGELNFENTYKQSFGLDLGYKFNSWIGVQTGVTYSKLGQDYSTSGNPNANYKTDLNYLKIPIQFTYTFRPDKKISFITIAGFHLGLLTEAKSSRMQGFGVYSPSYIDVKDYYSSSTIDLALGIGVQYNFRKLSINVSIQSDYSLSDIENADKKPGLRSPTSNFSIAIPQLGFYYFFK
jgi:hypothetical protein